MDEPQRLTPAEARAALIAAFPKFYWSEPVTTVGRLDCIKGIRGSAIITLNASHQGYRIQFAGGGIGLLLESLPAGEYSSTLAAAIAALRQAKAQHLQALEVLS